MDVPSGSMKLNHAVEAGEEAEVAVDTMAAADTEVAATVVAAVAGEC